MLVAQALSEPPRHFARHGQGGADSDSTQVV